MGRRGPTLDFSHDVRRQRSPDCRGDVFVQMIQTQDQDRKDLSNAIAINSSMANGARLIGPAIAGLVIAAFGEGSCFLIDGLSYFAVIASLLAMRLQPAPAKS